MKNKTIVCIVLVVAVALAWYMGLSTVSSDSNGYENHLNAGKSFEKEQLYRKAIAEYEIALTYEDSLDLRIKIVEMNKKAIENGELSSDGNLVSMLLDTMSVYRKDPRAYEAACNYFYSVTDYDELSNALLAAQGNEVTSKALDDVKAKVRYLYERQHATYSDYIDLTNGYYVIQELGNHYSVTESFATVLSGCDFIAPYSADGHTVAKKNNKVFILSSDGVRQKYLPDNIESSSGIAEGNIACRIGDKYAYYNNQGEKVSKDYAYAGRFSYGVAAVQETSGKWILINKKFQPLSNATYEDIKLNTAEECVSGGMILAKSGGKYSIINVSYNADKPEAVSITANNSFKCDDCKLPIDAATGSNKGQVWFAFKLNNKWGYADASGKTMIEPKFADAKSFSNGFAAVSDGEKWDFINESGTVVLDLNLVNAGYFNSNGVCLVKFDNGYWVYIRMYFWNI